MVGNMHFYSTIGDVVQEAFPKYNKSLISLPLHTIYQFPHLLLCHSIALGVYTRDSFATIGIKGPCLNQSQKMWNA